MEQPTFLAVTDADRALASELGLFLVHRPGEAPGTPGVPPPPTGRIPETWLVRSALTGRPVGRLCLTAVDCLYATKLPIHISRIEETIAEALRWIAPVTRHVRTGTYDGTEVIVRRFGSMRTRPRALTECGARSTGADYSPIAAQSELLNGGAHEMCPGCRARLEERGAQDLSHLPARDSSSTPRQRDYLRRLLEEGEQHGRPHLVEARSLQQMSCREASALIDRLRTLKERDWKGNL